jgi:hypothetical protein
MLGALATAITVWLAKKTGASDWFAAPYGAGGRTAGPLRGEGRVRTLPGRRGRSLARGPWAEAEDAMSGTLATLFARLAGAEPEQEQPFGFAQS